MGRDYAVNDREDKGPEMLSWLRRWRERAERAMAKAKTLVRAFGQDAYSEARLRERQADGAESARECRNVALAIARLTGRRVGLDTSTRMAMDADFGDREAPTTPAHEPQRKLDQIAELERIPRGLKAPQLS